MSRIASATRSMGDAKPDRRQKKGPPWRGRRGVLSRRQAGAAASKAELKASVLSAVRRLPTAQTQASAHGPFRVRSLAGGHRCAADSETVPSSCDLLDAEALAAATRAAVRAAVGRAGV